MDCRRCGTLFDPNAPPFRPNYTGNSGQIPQQPMQQMPPQPMPQPMMQPMPPPMIASGQLPYAINPTEARFKGGKTCPRCGITNSYSEYEGTVWILIVVLFITCLGLLFVPFLPKRNFCRACGNTWQLAQIALNRVPDWLDRSG